jgi:hypothetical protein
MNQISFFDQAGNLFLLAPKNVENLGLSDDSKLWRCLRYGHPHSPSSSSCHEAKPHHEMLSEQADRELTAN